MTSLPADRSFLYLVNLKWLRVSLTYVVPALAVLYVVLAGLWLVPDSFGGMYGNYDGHWASWSARGILEWSGFLDFSPFSPLVGTGSLFAPYLPWLNPGALALAIPAPLSVRHLASMLVYLAELSASLYLLYRHFEFSREHSFLATILYICVFFIPLSGYTQALPWFTLAPLYAHLIASMNVATIALIRLGYEELSRKLFFGFLFLVALFVAFASAPVTSVSYVPGYGMLWIAFLIPFQAQYRPVFWRWGAIAFALLVLGAIGVPSYLAATAMTSARGDVSSPIFHVGWQLLSPAYWQDLISRLPFCSNHLQLMCPFAPIGWFEIATLGGALYLILAFSGTKRRYGILIIALLASIHFYALLHMGMVLGRLHVVSTPYLMWAFFPLAAPAAVAVGSFAVRLATGRRAVSGWIPAAASCLIAAVAVFVWLKLILPHQPRLPGRGPLGLPPIAHVSVKEGPIVEYLRQRIGLQPGREFRGYASTFLGATDGLVRKSMKAQGDTVTWNAYVAARSLLFEHFGNSFQTMDLWNSGIPTFEEYGQWTSKQMYYFDRDLMAQPQDEIDPLMNSILLYRFRPLLLRALGVRFVIADGTLADGALEHVATEVGKAGASINLYEIKGANLGQFSPTRVMWAADYPTAASTLRTQSDFENRVVLLGPSDRQTDLVPASRSRLVDLRDGYQLTASAPGSAMLVLPVQFSHCWRIDNVTNENALRLVRANIIQTGILFKDNVDIRLRFDFEPWRASCRFRDAEDLSQFGFK
jgi:hypothetical protein